MSKKPNQPVPDDDKIVIASDGLPARTAGAWAEDKLHYLEGYAQIFTTSMKNKWPRRVYIDLFSGPGRSIIKGTSKEIDGSPVCAVNANIPSLTCT